MVAVTVYFILRNQIMLLILFCFVIG